MFPLTPTDNFIIPHCFDLISTWFDLFSHLVVHLIHSYHVRAFVLLESTMSFQLGWKFKFFTAVSACFVLDDLNGPLLLWKRLTLFGDRTDLRKRYILYGVIIVFLEAEFLLRWLSIFDDLLIRWLITKSKLFWRFLLFQTVLERHLIFFDFDILFDL